MERTKIKHFDLFIFLYIIIYYASCKIVIPVLTIRTQDVGLFLIVKNRRLNDSEKILTETQMRVDRSAQEKKQINFVSQVVCASRRMVRVNNVALSHVPIQELSLNGQIDTQVGNLIVWFYFVRRLSGLNIDTLSAECCERYHQIENITDIASIAHQQFIIYVLL